MWYDDNAKILRLHGTKGSEYDDYLNILGQDRLLVELSEKDLTGKGKNSSVFMATDTIGDDDPYIVKFCQFHTKVRGELAEEKRKRFLREIDAAKRAVAENCGQYLVEVVTDGYLRLDDERSIPYYVMEKADEDLGEYLENNVLTVQQKLVLFLEILRAMNALHEIGLYHRDLKPDNLFSFGGKWKLGDLGFAEFQDDDFLLDGLNQKIGPAGLMSPEATNKLLAYRQHPLFAGDCTIDARSDVYQLGNIFWLIMQGDIPTGQLDPADFNGEDQDIYTDVLVPMLQHKKTRRPKVDEVLSNCEPLFAKYSVT